MKTIAPRLRKIHCLIQRCLNERKKRPNLRRKYLSILSLHDLGIPHHHLHSFPTLPFSAIRASANGFTYWPTFPSPPPLPNNVISFGMQRIRWWIKKTTTIPRGRELGWSQPQLFGSAVSLNINEAPRKWQSGGVHGSARAGLVYTYVRTVRTARSRDTYKRVEERLEHESED